MLLFVLICLRLASHSTSIGPSAAYCSVANATRCKLSPSAVLAGDVTLRSCCFFVSSGDVLLNGSQVMNLTFVDVDVQSNLTVMTFSRNSSFGELTANVNMALINSAVAVSAPFFRSRASGITVSISLLNTTFSSESAVLAVDSGMAASYRVEIFGSVVNLTNTFLECSNDPLPVPLFATISNSTIRSGTILFYFSRSATAAQITFTRSTVSVYQGAFAVYYDTVLSSVWFAMRECTFSSESALNDAAALAYAAYAVGVAVFDVVVEDSVLSVKSAGMGTLVIAANLHFVMNRCAVTMSSMLENSLIVAGSNSTVRIAGCSALLKTLPLKFSAWISTPNVSSVTQDVNCEVLDSSIWSSFGFSVLGSLIRLMLRVHKVKTTTPLGSLLTVTGSLSMATITLQNSSLSIYGLMIFSADGAVGEGVVSWTLENNVFYMPSPAAMFSSVTTRAPQMSVVLGCNFFGELTMPPGQQLELVLPVNLGPSIGSVSKTTDPCWAATESYSLNVSYSMQTSTASSSHSNELAVMAPRLQVNDVPGSILAAGAVLGAASDAYGLSSFFLFVSCGAGAHQQQQRGLTRYLLSPLIDFGAAAVVFGNSAIVGLFAVVVEGSAVLVARICAGSTRSRAQQRKRKAFRTRMRLPGLYVQLGGLLAQGPLLFGSGLLFAPDNFVDGAIGLWGVLGGVITAIAYRGIARTATKQLHIRPHPTFSQFPPYMKPFFATRVLRPVVVFQSFRSVMGAFLPRQARVACLVHIGSLLIASVVAGVQFPSNVCWLQWSLLACLAAAAALYYAWKRPFRILAMNVLECTSFVNLFSLDLASALLEVRNDWPGALWWVQRGGVGLQLFVALTKLFLMGMNSGVEFFLPRWRRSRKQRILARSAVENLPVDVVLSELMLHKLFSESFGDPIVSAELTMKSGETRNERALHVLVRFIAASQILRLRQEVHCSRIVTAAACEEGNGTVVSEDRVAQAIGVATQLSLPASSSEPLAPHQLVEAAIIAICKSSAENAK